jgi:hypothetical protein
MLRARLSDLERGVATHLAVLAGRLEADDGIPALYWRSAELDDPVLLPMTRALVWLADTPRGPVVGLPVRRKRSVEWVLRDLRGRFHELTESTPIRLWDARAADEIEIRAWREALRHGGLVQPVPQLPPDE